MARGGVFVAGGIAPKILPRLRAGGFIVAFNDKGDFSEYARRVPVHVVANERLGLIGAAAAAQIRHGARLKRAIVDRYNTVEPEYEIGIDREADRSRHFVTDSGMGVVNKGPYQPDLARYH